MIGNSWLTNNSIHCDNSKLANLNLVYLTLLVLRKNACKPKAHLLLSLGASDV
jgi:hypothetical protein